MFRLFKKLDNESGVVLFIVLITAIIIMIVSASILSQSMNEINFAQQQIDEIATDQLQKGIFWNYYSVSMQNIPAGPMTFTLQGRTYQGTIAPVAPTPGGSSYTTTGSYDSFQ
jgi:hypothetical protein